MPLPEVCVCYLVRERADGLGLEVLLGRKKRGLGTGKYVAPGGKLEPGESARVAMVREVAEETTLTITADDLEARGVLTYLFPTKPSWSQVSHVFVCRTWQGDPVESDELAPEWFDLAALPLDAMWDDAKNWLPDALGGTAQTHTFVFGPDLSTVDTSTHPAVQPRQNAATSADTSDA